MTKWLLSCEHGGNLIPEGLADYFQDYKDLLQTHRSYDIGVGPLYDKLSKVEIFDFAIKNTYSRLLIDFNRSLKNRNLFSEISRGFSKDIKNQLIRDLYLPYRKAVQHNLSRWIAENRRVIHISLHSFTPVFNNITRNNDIGLLYDPKRTEEMEFSRSFKAEILRSVPNWKIRLNYPYTGVADGLTRSMRKIFHKNYIGIEVEINQKLFLSENSGKPAPLISLLAALKNEEDSIWK